jgi:uncharacterized membrane protein
MSPEPRANPNVDLVLSLLLRVGVLLCAAVIAVGWVGHLLRPPVNQAAAIPILASGGMLAEQTVAHSLKEVAAGLAAGSPRAVIVLGLMLLIGLPIARVGLTVAAFWLERDWLYAALAALVLALLLSGLLLGRAL